MPGKSRLTAGWRRVGVVDKVAELVPPGDAEFGVRTVQMGGDGMRRKEQTVGDLPVRQAAPGEDNDLALLRGQLAERARDSRRGRRGHPASAQFGFRAPGPRRRAEAAECFEGGA